MKQNLTLLLILAVLTSITYFIVERPANNRYEKEIKLHNIFQLKNKNAKITSIELNNCLFKNINGSYKVFPGNYSADSKVLDKFFQKISYIKPDKIISNQENISQFIPKKPLSIKFTFSDNTTIQASLGYDLNYSDQFYMQTINSNKKKTVIIASYNDPSNPIFIKGSDVRYKSVQAILSLGPSFFYDKHLFLNKKNSIKSITINNKELSNNKIKIINRTKGDKIFLNFNKKKLKTQLAQIQFIATNNKNEMITIYSSYKKWKGYFATLSFSNHLFQLSKSSATNFLPIK